MLFHAQFGCPSASFLPLRTSRCNSARLPPCHGAIARPKPRGRSSGHLDGRWRVWTKILSMVVARSAGQAEHRQDHKRQAGFPVLPGRLAHAFDSGRQRLRVAGRAFAGKPCQQAFDVGMPVAHPYALSFGRGVKQSIGLAGTYPVSVGKRGKHPGAKPGPFPFWFGSERRTSSARSIAKW